jgi:hypothetical protein
MSDSSSAGGGFASKYQNRGAKPAGTDSGSAGGFAAKYQSQGSGFTSEGLKPKDSQNSINSKKVDPMKKAQAEFVYLVKGIDDNRKAWYYVLVEKLKLQLFLKALNDDIIHLENYGKILYSAYGEEPPASITNQLKEEYGIED